MDRSTERKTSLLGMTPVELTGVVLDNGMPKFAAAQITAWLYKKYATSIGEMTDLSKNARARLEEHYIVGRYSPINSIESIDGTIKYLFEIPDGNKIESVYIPDRDRATLCVSSQAGCRMNCKFCMTGRLGFHGNLSAGDIINQILSIPGYSSLTNIVYMGMGEPLDNYDEVLKSLNIMTEPWGLAWSPRRITVSTIGKLDFLKRLLDETNVNIAISVHTPFSDERSRLMPVEKAFPINEVIDLLKRYDFTRQRRCSFEYIIWKGINDSIRHAAALTRLLHKIPGVRVNLIRFHAFKEAPELQPAPLRDMESFRDYLNLHGITATIRASRGEDIQAACGMLANKAY